MGFRFRDQSEWLLSRSIELPIKCTLVMFPSRWQIGVMVIGLLCIGAAQFLNFTKHLDEAEEGATGYAVDDELLFR